MFELHNCAVAFWK